MEDKLKTETVELIERPDSWFSAIHVETDTMSRGETESAALQNLAEALEMRENARHTDPNEVPKPNVPWF